MLLHSTVVAYSLNGLLWGIS